MFKIAQDPNFSQDDESGPSTSARSQIPNHYDEIVIVCDFILKKTPINHNSLVSNICLID